LTGEKSATLILLPQEKFKLKQEKFKLKVEKFKKESSRDPTSMREKELKPEHERTLKKRIKKIVQRMRCAQMKLLFHCFHHYQKPRLPAAKPTSPSCSLCS